MAQLGVALLAVFAATAPAANGASARSLANGTDPTPGRRLRGRLDEDDEARAGDIMFVPLQRPALASAVGHARNWRRAARAAADGSAPVALAASVSTWLSAAALQRPAPAVGSAAVVRRVARREAPVDGGAAQVFVPTARERGNVRLDTPMGCHGWRETAGCAPHGPLVSLAAAASCNIDVSSDRSGHCECTVGGDGRSGSGGRGDGGSRGDVGVVVRAGHAACEHQSFRCRDVCRRPPRRLCRGFVAMDSCVPQAPGAGGSGWDFLAGKVTVGPRH